MVEIVVRLSIEQEEVPGEGWVVRAPEVHATAQGATLDEATANLLTLIQTYSDVLQPLVEAAVAQPPRLELIAV
jgi:predicted RNase H-like HicB family nuclease